MADAMRVDIADLKALVRDMRTVDKKAGLTIGKAMREAAKPIAAQAQQAAPAVHVSAGKGAVRGARRTTRGNGTQAVVPVVKATGGVKGLTLKASTPGSPVRSAAWAFEFGRNHGGSFRHPLFGNREHWYAQVKRPYMTPARDMHVERLAEAISEAVKTTIEGL